MTRQICETYDHVEIPTIEPDVTRVTLHGGVCPCCAKKFKAAPPSGMEPGSPFRENLRALVIYLRFTQGIAFERLARLLSGIRGLEISEGALVNMLEAAREAFAAQINHIRARLLSGTILQSDETGLRAGKRNWWLWVFHHDDSAIFVIEPSRGKCVVEGFLGAFRPDFWVSDRYGGQRGPGGWRGWRPSILALDFHSAPCTAVQRDAKFGGALPQPFVYLTDRTRPMWLEFRVGVSDHCQRFGNCLGLAIPARRMDSCYARLLQYLRAINKADVPVCEILDSAFRQNDDISSGI